jgi:hypothetical protein
VQVTGPTWPKQIEPKSSAFSSLTSMYWTSMPKPQEKLSLTLRAMVGCMFRIATRE